MVRPLPQDEFEDLVEDACDRVPDALWERLDNVAIVVEDANDEEPDLLGLYEGVAQTERGEYAFVLPDKITVYRLPLCALAHDREELVTEIAVTVVHEIAHHLGIDEDRLHALGWG